MSSMTLSSLKPRTKDSAEGHRLLSLFLGLMSTGGIGLVVIICTALVSRNVKRHLTWMNFCVTWVISTVSYLILPILGHQTGPEPQYGLCLFQAALLYGAPTLTASSTLALVLQLWFTLRESLQESSGSPPQNKYMRTLLLVTAPYLIYSVFVLESSIIGLRNPTLVRRADSDVYCIIDDGAPGKATASFVLLAMIVTIVFEVSICLAIRRNWHTFRRCNKQWGASLTMLTRVAIFSVVGITAIGVSLVFLSDISSIVPNLFMAILPLAATLVFGAQADIIHAWMFWKPEVGPPVPDKPKLAA